MKKNDVVALIIVDLTDVFLTFSIIKRVKQTAPKAQIDSGSNADKEQSEVETGKMYSGFRVCKSEFIKEVNSTAYLMEHVLSGACLLYLVWDLVKMLEQC